MSIVDSAGDSTWAELPHELQHIITCCLDVQGLCQFAGCSRYSERLVQVATDRWSQHFLELYPGLLCILGSKANNRKWGSILGELNWRELHRAVRLRRTFQAQVFNREADNSAEDFTNSCYDATVSYQGTCQTTGQPLFSAKYLPMGKERVEESGITLARLRPVPAASHPHRVARWRVSSVSEGEQVEVQWRGDKAHPFGWWFGTVRRVLRTSVVIEFPQYPQHSPWRSVLVPVAASKGGVVNVDRRFGYLGGLRTLTDEERSRWAAQQVGTETAAGANSGSGAGPEGQGGIVGGGLAAALASAAEMAEEVGVEVNPEQVGLWVQLELAAHAALQPGGQLLGGFPAHVGIGGWLMELGQ